MPSVSAMPPSNGTAEQSHLLLAGDASLDPVRRALVRAGHTVTHVQPLEALERLAPETCAAVLAGRRAEILRLCTKIKERRPAPFMPVLVLLRPPARLPQEPTAPDAWINPRATPGEVVARVAELLRVRRADGEMVRLNALLAELAAENGMLYEHARKEADSAATLLRELQHRVRNNLAAIQALLILERGRQPPRALPEALDVAIGRLRSMAALQDVLAASVEVNVASLATAIARGVCEVIAGPPLAVEVTGDATVSPRAASSLAIVLNELICNARRHGGATAVRIAIAPDGDALSLQFRDDGAGLPEMAREGSGLMIARTVVRNELGGSFELAPPGGPALIRLMLPLERIAANGKPEVR